MQVDPTDDVNRAIIGNVAMQVAPPGGQTCNYAGSAIWWPKLEPMEFLTFQLILHSF